MEKKNIPAGWDKAQEILPASAQALNQEPIKGASANFYHYSSLDSVTKILSPDDLCYFFVRPITEMNDIAEKKHHIQLQHNAKSIFVLCFCNSETDNIPMWYLYGGLSGQGAKLGFTADKMDKLIQNINYIEIVENNRLSGEKLYRDRFSLHYGWVFYNKQDYKYIKHRSKKYRITDSNEAFVNDNYFIKDYAWNYEKEFRIVIHIHGENVPERIAIPFSKKALLNGLSVTTGPEATEGVDVNPIDISRFTGLPVDKIKKSKLNVKMDLLTRNKDLIAREFDNLLKAFTDSDKDVSNLVNMYDSLKNHRAIKNQEQQLKAYAIAGQR